MRGLGEELCFISGVVMGFGDGLVSVIRVSGVFNVDAPEGDGAGNGVEYVE